MSLEIPKGLVFLLLATGAVYTLLEYLVPGWFGRLASLLGVG